MPGAKRGTKVYQCLDPPSVQMRVMNTGMLTEKVITVDPQPYVESLRLKILI